MNDLEIAKTQLQRKELTLVIVKNGEVLFETHSHRISGFLGAIEKFGTLLEDAAVADTVAGKAVALLCVYAKISNVYAEVLSEKARAVFEENGIGHEWKELVDNILNFNKSQVCPLEKAAAGIFDPRDAYKAFKALPESLNAYK